MNDNGESNTPGEGRRAYIGAVSLATRKLSSTPFRAPTDITLYLLKLTTRQHTVPLIASRITLHHTTHCDTQQDTTPDFLVSPLTSPSVITLPSMDSTYDPSQSGMSAYSMALTATLGTAAVAATAYGGKVALQSLGPTKLGYWLGCTGPPLKSALHKTGASTNQPSHVNFGVDRYSRQTEFDAYPTGYFCTMAKERHPSCLRPDEITNLGLNLHNVDHSIAFDPEMYDKRLQRESKAIDNFLERQRRQLEKSSLSRSGRSTRPRDTSGSTVKPSKMPIDSPSSGTGGPQTSFAGSSAVSWHPYKSSPPYKKYGF